MGNLQATTPIFGQESGYLYVNSAQSMSADDAYAVCSADTNGRVPVAMVQEQTGCDVFGRVAIRREIERYSVLVRPGGEPYTKRQANNIMARARYLKYWNGIPCARGEDVQADVRHHVAAVSSAHAAAAIERWRGEASTSSPTGEPIMDVSSSSRRKARNL